MSTKGKVDGEHVLYHFLQKELLRTDVWLFQMLASKLVASLGIWMSPKLYTKLPLLAPYAVRDNSCRKSKSNGVEQWSSPNEDGYLRDDNSLIKDIPRSFVIKSPLEIYSGKNLDTGFVASHVWRITNQPDVCGGSASKNPFTYSFIPNLVWLPGQVAKLTDREGSFTQLYLQALSSKIYRHLDVLGPTKKFTEQCWSYLPKPVGIPEQGLPDLDELSFFEETDDFIQKRGTIISKVADALSSVVEGKALNEKILSSRYTEGLNKIDKSAAKKLSVFLKEYAMAVQ
ncbi:MAG: hypothetical protein Greene041619_320 [Candidatus Peregrinibacteria bacterium Greene0416_19]|nr:MAG: hypothetical protein Greene041619_320 [Candidatus Peregrinibacteria bacterium Greene0416_19]